MRPLSSFGCVVTIMAALAGCGSLGQLLERHESLESGQVGGVWLADDATTTARDKLVVASYRFTANRIDVLESRLIPGAAKVPRSDGGDFRVVLTTTEGEILAQYAIRNPRKVVVEHKGLIETAEALYVARFPFNRRAEEIRILDRRGRPIATTSLSQAVQQFCLRAKEDEDCRRLQP